MIGRDYSVSAVKVGKLMLSYVPSDLFVDVALVGIGDPVPAAANAAVSDDLNSRLEMGEVHSRFAG